MSDVPARFDLDALDGRVADDPGAPEFPALAEALRRSGLAERAREVAVAGLEHAPSRLAGRVALALAQMDLGAFEDGRAELEGVLDEMLEPYRLDGEPEADLTPVATAYGTSEAEGSRDFAPIDVHPMIEVTDEGGSLEALGEHEIDAAFEEAESRAEEMHSPNTTAERVLEAEVPVAGSTSSSSLSEGADVEPPFEHDTEGEGEHLGDSDLNGGKEFDITASPAFATRTMAGLLERQGDSDRADSIRGVLGQSAPLEMDAAEAPADGADSASAAKDVAYRERVVATLEKWLHNIGRGTA